MVISELMTWLVKTKMRENIRNFDAIVVGAGHAGVEAALALSRLGNQTLLLTLSLDSIAFLACNPSIGGTAKGHLVCEIDALGGQMGITADATAIQIRMLNDSKGPAVHSLRAQIDKTRYHEEMKKILENTENLVIKQAEVKEILTKDGKFCGIKTTSGKVYHAQAIVVATGVYLNSRTIMGEFIQNTGPSGFQNASYLTKSLQKLGFSIRRFKTGTPPRIDKMTVDFSKFEEQKGDDGIQPFSFLSKKAPKNVSSCFLGYTSKKTKSIILANLDRAPLFSGTIKGTGPRYCPSIEDKITRFADKERHQIFLEPESLTTNETYMQGLSTSMPVDIQERLVHSISGLENAEIMRYAYAIEYDCIDSTDLFPTLEYKKVSGIFTAGQINGTSGYEEAAAQGLIAGINASQKIKNQPQLILGRDTSYIGVLIDDLVTKGTNEPYRMMTSRAEYRLSLRQDNADLRLTEIGRKIGIVDKKRYILLKNKQKSIKIAENELSTLIKKSDKLNSFLERNGEHSTSSSLTVHDLLRRANVDIFEIKKEFGLFDRIQKDALLQVQINVKYEGYLKKQSSFIEKNKKLENLAIPEDFDYSKIHGLRIEAKQKLERMKPLTIGQASRISGVSPADISILLFYLRKR